MSLSLEGDGGDESLDTRGNALILFTLLGDGATDDVLGDRVALVQSKELADLVGTLGPESTGDRTVGQTRNLALALFHNDEVENRQVVVDNAPTHRFALALASSTWAVALLALGQEQLDTTNRTNTYAFTSFII